MDLDKKEIFKRHRNQTIDLICDGFSLEKKVIAGKIFTRLIDIAEEADDLPMLRSTMPMMRRILDVDTVEYEREDFADTFMSFIKENKVLEIVDVLNQEPKIVDNKDPHADYLCGMTLHFVGLHNIGAQR